MKITINIKAADGKRNSLTSDGKEAMPACAAGKRLGDTAAKASKTEMRINFFIWMFMIKLLKNERMDDAESPPFAF